MEGPDLTYPQLFPEQRRKKALEESEGVCGPLLIASFFEVRAGSFAALLAVVKQSLILDASLFSAADSEGTTFSFLTQRFGSEKLGFGSTADQHRLLRDTSLVTSPGCWISQSSGSLKCCLLPVLWLLSPIVPWSTVALEGDMG